MYIEALDDYRVRCQRLESTHILIVEDNITERKIYRQTLHNYGFTVTDTGSSKDAVRLLEKGDFTLVLLDVILPGMNGIEILKAIRSRYSASELPVILLTSQGENDKIVKALSLGASDYLVKPVSLSVLCARIETHLSYKRITDQLLESRKELELRIEDEEASLQATNVALESVTAKYRETQNRIKKNEILTQSIFNTGLIGVAVFNPETGLSAINEKYCEILGYSREELLDMSWEEIIHPDDINVTRELFNQLIGREIDRYTLDIRCIRKGGEIVYVTSSLEAVCNPDGDIDYCLGFIQDISPAKKAERERQELEKQLFRSQKMDAIGQLTGGIAHDFNNILQGILGYTKLALRYSANKDDDRIIKYLNEVQLGGERARDIVSQMLTFSRKTPGQPSNQSLQELIENVFRLLRPTLPSNIDIKLVVQDDVPEVMIDPVQFEQVIMNLCINARDAIENNGSIEIILSSISLKDTECNSCYEQVSGNYIVVAVKDTGHGIPDEIISQMFEPFYTTKEIGKGTGMGLSMVHGILHGCSGHILVESKTGKGTEFRLLIPDSSQTNNK